MTDDNDDLSGHVIFLFVVALVAVIFFILRGA